ncbi:MAG TPA: hypothetical protein VGL89_02170 [Candidatus Koribacter sp.]
MKDRNTPPPHPGPFRIPKLAAEFDSVLIAVGFIVLGLAGLPLAKFFLIGAVAVGVIIAVLFRILRKKPLFPSHFLQ